MRPGPARQQRHVRRGRRTGARALRCRRPSANVRGENESRRPLLRAASHSRILASTLASAACSGAAGASDISNCPELYSAWNCSITRPARANAVWTSSTNDACSSSGARPYAGPPRPATASSTPSNATNSISVAALTCSPSASAAACSRRSAPRGQNASGSPSWSASSVGAHATPFPRSATASRSARSRMSPTAPKLGVKAMPSSTQKITQTGEAPSPGEWNTGARSSETCLARSTPAQSMNVPRNALTPSSRSGWTRAPASITESTGRRSGVVTDTRPAPLSSPRSSAPLRRFRVFGEPRQTLPHSGDPRNPEDPALGGVPERRVPGYPHIPTLRRPCDHGRRSTAALLADGPRRAPGDRRRGREVGRAPVDRPGARDGRRRPARRSHRGGRARDRQDAAARRRGRAGDGRRLHRDRRHGRRGAPRAVPGRPVDPRLARGRSRGSRSADRRGDRPLPGLDVGPGRPRARHARSRQPAAPHVRPRRRRLSGRWPPSDRSRS